MIWQEISTENDWEDANICDLFLKGMYRSRRATRTFGKVMAKQKQDKGKHLHDALANAQLAIESNPDDILIRSEISV